jgi:DNA-binding cell septation regulator SpoVG
MRKGESKKMKDLVISEVQITPVKPKEGLVAFASCVINNQLYIGNIAIYTRPDGNDFRLAYPTKTLPNGKQINCVHPINRQAGEIIRRKIVERFVEISSKLAKSPRCDEEVRFERSNTRQSL